MKRPNGDYLFGDPSDSDERVAKYGSPIPGHAAAYDADSDTFTSGSYSISSFTAQVTLRDTSGMNEVNDQTTAFDDSGLWEFVVLDERAGESPSMSITITGEYQEPNITISGITTKEVDSGDFTLTTTNTGGPIDSYQWSRDGSVISGATSSSYTSSSNLALGNRTFSVTATGREWLDNAAQTSTDDHTVNIFQDLPNLIITSLVEGQFSFRTEDNSSIGSYSWSISNGCGTNASGTGSSPNSGATQNYSASFSQPACGSSDCSYSVSVSASGFDSGSRTNTISAAVEPSFSPNRTYDTCMCGSFTSTRTGGIGNPSVNYLDCAGTQFPSTANTAACYTVNGGIEIVTLTCSQSGSGNNYNCAAPCGVICQNLNNPDLSSCPYTG